MTTPDPMPGEEEQWARHGLTEAQELDRGETDPTPLEQQPEASGERCPICKGFCSGCPIPVPPGARLTDDERVIRLKGFVDGVTHMQAKLAAAEYTSASRLLTINRLSETLETAQAEVARLEDENSQTYCAYCGIKFVRDDEAATKVTEHIYICIDHPMRLIEAERDAALAHYRALVAGGTGDG